MSKENNVEDHYSHPSLLALIKEGLKKQGKSLVNLTLDDIAPIDEFHIGGRQASVDFFSQLSFDRSMNVLDLGCGLGGPARFVAKEFGCSVAGVDLTTDYVNAGNELSKWVGLELKVKLQQGSILDLPFHAGSFDVIYMMHVGMNIHEKEHLAKEAFRVLKPRGVFGIYDVMRIGEGDVQYPVPWATTEKTSALEKPEQYQAHLSAAGFSPLSIRERGDFAQEFFEKMAKNMGDVAGPPPLGLHVLMGDNAKEKASNVLSMIKGGLLAPVELIALKVS
jgi:ubiquinone/menaquinone biosynthesis C-methylase UbiE